MEEVCDVIISSMKKPSQRFWSSTASQFILTSQNMILKDARIEPYPSDERSFDVESGYLPNSHDMPNEFISDKLKENARVAFQKVRKTHQAMKSVN